ncbi:MAG TPA: CAP domain-containing protein [Gemmatimonadaceae bacterium]|nr:CAP domain-containing protein [Gemmatimonadaceae bacterium]
MRTLRFPLLLVSTFLVGCAYPLMEAPARESASHSSSAPAASTLEGRIFDLINGERRQHGLQPLEYNGQLDQMAQIQAANMAYYRQMAHVIPEAKLPTLVDRARSVGYPYGLIAENVALGYPTAETVVNGWMNSRGHRENILDRGLVETGIAVRRSRDGGLYYCQVFGHRRTTF